ncbi:MAG: hypothetical protein A4E20_08730 [Nitrospira sp. SG-bin2]|nr:MAG: hypothetical protein A4E20_08730 [Nitrospira sp. SG-bin2]
MRRMATFLALLLLVLTFNAYACILPLQSATQMDCSSETEEPVRGTCDAFLEIGPHSQFSSNHAIGSLHLECTAPVQVLPDTFIPLVRMTEPPRSADTPIHPSIHTTVLRI